MARNIKKSLFKADVGFKYDNLSIFHGDNDPTVTTNADQDAAGIGSEYVLDSTGEKYIKKASGWEKLTTLGELPNISNISYREPVKVSASDTTLPTGVSGNNITVDGVSIDENERVLFGNLSSGNKNIYIYDKASGLFIEDTNTVSAGDVTYIVGGTDGGKQVVFNGTSWVLFNQVALDELGYLRAFMGKNAAGNELPSYSSNNYIANNDSLETALGKLDTAINSIATSSGADETNIRNFIGKAATGATLPNYSSNNFIQDNWSLQQAVSTLDLWLGTDHTNLGNAQTDIQDIKNNLIPQLQGKVLNGVKYLVDCPTLPTTATFFADADGNTNQVTVVGGDYVAFSSVTTPGVYRWNGSIFELQPMIHEGRLLVIQKDYTTDTYWTNVQIVVWNASGNYFEFLPNFSQLQIDVSNNTASINNHTSQLEALSKVTEFADFKAFNATIPTNATFNTDFHDTINPITVDVGSKVLFLELTNKILRGLYEWTGSGFTRIYSKTSLFSVKYNEALGTSSAGVGVLYGDGQEVGVLINAQGGYAFLATETKLNNQLANYVLTSTLTSDYYNQTQVNSLISNAGNKITKVKYSVSRKSLPTTSTFFADELNQFSVTVANGDLVAFPYLSAANIGIYKWNNANSQFDLLVDIDGNRENILFYVEYDYETNTLFDYSIDGIKPGIVMKIGSNYHIQFLASNEWVNNLNVNLNNIYREVFKNGQVYEVADSGAANTNNTFITVSDLTANGFADINDFLKLTLDVTMKKGTNFTSFKIDVIINEDGISADSSAYAILNIGSGVNYSYTFDTNKDLVLTSTDANASIKVKRVVVYGMAESPLFQ